MEKTVTYSHIKGLRGKNLPPATTIGQDTYSITLSYTKL